jgi:hypothetical protein
MSRFDFGKKNENCNDSALKKYFIENKYFGLQHYTVNYEAKEFVVFTENFIVNCEDERKRIEIHLKTRKECDFKFPFSIGVQFGVVYYTEKTKDFALYVPNKRAIYLYLFRPFDEAIKHLELIKKNKKANGKS